MVLDNGDIYEGDFYQNKIEGEGTYWYNNGDKYEGMLCNGSIHGKGLLYVCDEHSFYDCIFEKGAAIEGSWICGVNNFFYKGPFYKGKPHGKGIFTSKSGRTEIINFDHLNGPDLTTAKLIDNFVPTISIPITFLQSKPTENEHFPFIAKKIAGIMPPLLFSNSGDLLNQVSPTDSSIELNFEKKLAFVETLSEH